jgi:predicted nucleic-acid-binding protein
MIVLDTNYYIRYFTADNEEQFPIAKNQILNIENNKIVVFLPDLVLAEIVYVLTKLYEVSRKQVCESLESLINLKSLKMQDKSLVNLTLSLFAKSNLDFVDCYLIALSQIGSEYSVHTFDRKLQSIISKK